MVFGEIIPLQKSKQKQRITPLHWDPKQQELSTHVRPSFGLGPWKCSKRIGFIDSVKKMLKRHWFYRLGSKKSKSIGFIDSVQENQSTKHFFGGALQNNRKMGLKVVRPTKTVKKKSHKAFLLDFFKKLEREALVLSHQRIRAVSLQYSSGYVMRNPYRQAV